MRHRWLKVLTLCSSSMIGCSSLQEAKQEYLLGYRNTKLAEEAWKSMAGEYCNNLYNVDFERGWKQGYYDVASGGTGCAPAIPPSRYWHIRYQNSCGHQRVMAWFNGYREGSLVAEQDGVAAFSAIPTLYNPNSCNKSGTGNKAKRPGQPAANPDMAPAGRPAPPARGVMAPLPVRPINSTPRDQIAPIVAPPAGLPLPPPAKAPVLPQASNNEKPSSPIAKRAGDLTPSGLTTAVPLYAKTESKS